MKRFIALLAFIIMTVVAFTADAAGKSGSKYKYVVLDDNTIRITQIPYSCENTFTIPAKIDGYKVSAVYGGAFFNTGIQHIIFSEGIKELGGFQGTISIKAITIPASMTDINLGDGVKFVGCDYLEAIHVNNRNPVYADENGCLINIKTKELIYYPVAAKAKKIQTPENIKTIGTYAFYENRFLESLIISEGVETIEKQAISRCKKLRTIEFPSTISLSSLNGDNFYECSQMTKVTVAKDSPYLQVVNGALIDMVEQKLLYMPDKAKVSSYTVPDFVKDIEKDAFRSCVNLTSVRIPGTVEIIEGRAFEKCKNLKKVVIEEGVKYVSQHAFRDCPKLKNIDYPESVKLFYRTPSPYATEDDIQHGN